MAPDDDHLRGLASDGGRVVALLDGDLDAPVPTCPGWDLRRLGQHLFWVYDNVRQVLESGRSLVELTEAPAPDDADLGRAVEVRLERLLTELGRRDPAEPTWTWAGPAEVRFWRRRTAAESLVHRTDAEAAAASFTAVEPGPAADAVDEYLTVLLPVLGRRPPRRPIRLRSTDVEGDWVIGNEPTVAVVASAPAAALLAACYGRGERDQLAVEGDAPVLDEWLATPAF